MYINKYSSEGYKDIRKFLNKFIKFKIRITEALYVL